MPYTGIEQKMLEQMESINKGLHELAGKPRSGPAPTGVLSGFGHDPAWNNWNNPDLNAKLEAMRPYDESSVRLLTKSKQSRMTGIGPYLCRMAAEAAKSVNHTQTLNLLQGQGLFDPAGNYGTEQLEREFGVWSAAAPRVVKSLDGREIRKTALAENSGITGGYTVPPQFMNELLTIGAEDGFIEPRAKVLPMNTRSVQWPMLDITTAQALGTSPYFGGILAQWQPEAQSINETEPAFKQSEWTAWDLVLYTVSSNQLLADNGIGLDALLTQLFGAAIVWYKEFAYLRGTGAGSTMPLGLLNAPATLSQTKAVAGHFTLADAAGMLSKLQIRSWDSACWMMHQSNIPDLIQMSDISTAPPGSAGQHLQWVSPLGDGRGNGPLSIKLPQAFLGGLPLFFTEKLPKQGTNGTVLLADWSRYVIGTRLDIQIDVSPHFLFRNNQLAWRVIARLDAKPWLNSFITDAEGYQVSPFVYVTQ